MWTRRSQLPSSRSQVPAIDSGGPVEIIDIGKTRARKCGGCSAPLKCSSIPYGSKIGLKFSYQSTFYDKRINSERTVQSSVYLHSLRKCLSKALPLLNTNDPHSFIISSSTFIGNQKYTPSECLRFENEFAIKINDIPVTK